MLSFWMFLIPWGIWDDELNYSTLKSLKRIEKLVWKISILVDNSCWAIAVYSHEHEDIQKESWDFSDTAGLCQNTLFCWAIVVCLKGVVWEHNTFVCSLNWELASRILRHSLSWERKEESSKSQVQSWVRTTCSKDSTTTEPSTFPEIPILYWHGSRRPSHTAD